MITDLNPKIFNQKTDLNPKVIIQKTGAFKGGFLGFFVGFATAGVICYSYLLEDYKNTSFTLLEGVSKLHKSMLSLREYTVKVDQLEEKLANLSASMASTEDLNRLKKELVLAIVLII